MNKTWIIARQEFLATIRRISYILVTISFPVLAVLGILIYQAVAHWAVAPPAEEQRIGYVDETGIFDQYTSQPGFLFVPYASEDEAKEALFSEDVSQYFIISSDYLATGQITRYTTERELVPPEATMERMQDFLISNLLAGETSQQVLERVKTPLVPVSYRLDPETGEVVPPGSQFAAIGFPYIFGLLFILSIFFSSGFLLQGVAEEKENRLIEILLSSVSARQLLSGKVIGLGAAGLIQIVIWLLCAVAIAAIASISIPFLAGLTIPIGLIVFGIIYFILGYLLFGTLMAGLGSIGSTAREGQQWSGIFTLPAVLPLWLGSLIVIYPNHILATILTLFPITAPITAVMRLSVIAIPTWQLLLSLALLAASVVAMMWLSARVFRVCLLMYGKRPSLREMWRYIREG